MSNSEAKVVFWTIIAILVVCGSVFGLSLRATAHGNAALRAKCDSHGGVYVAIRDGGEVLSVTCKDREQFAR